MIDTAIRVEDLGKLYRIGAHQERYGTLRDSLAGAVTGPWRRLRHPQPAAIRQQNTFWALKNVSFEVKKGEALGIIGRNGAGKSTLLKILSRITEPTRGRVRIRGRVSSLLEVGTGFHAELTGRENIYLNAAILGMRRTEIPRKFDEIVAFADIERFLDTPVKRYSSGMYVRLAFAVAAHLEPEILLVDEVLAVGDIDFQKKCLGKMGDVVQEGRVVLFVSHNMPAVTRLCNRVLRLEHGNLIEDGPTGSVVGHYVQSDLGVLAVQEWGDSNAAPGDEVVRLRAVRVLDETGHASDTIDIRKPVQIQMEYTILNPGTVLRPWYVFWNEDGICAFATTDTDPAWTEKARTPGRYSSSVIIPGNFLAEGGFSVTVGLAAVRNFAAHLTVNGAVTFQVMDTLDGDSARGESGGPFPGVVRPKLDWTTRFLDE